MQYTKKFVGLPPAANGVDDGSWWPWAVVMRHSDGRVQEQYFNTEAQADECLAQKPAGTVVPFEVAGWAA